jgi:hypothetical protein
LTGSSREQALLNLMPSDAIVRSAWTISDLAPKTALSKIRPVCRDFDSPAAAIAEIAAVQRGWRDFRMAQ